MWYPDRSPCDYFGAAAAPWLRSVGWLERGKPFESGAPDEALVSKLREMVAAPYQPLAMMGPHQCDLCLADGVHGAKNLWIPGDGFLYVCPELIRHYIEVHGYRPPDEFVDAVLKCPPMDSPEFKRAFFENGGREFVQAAQSSMSRMA